MRPRSATHHRQAGLPAPVARCHPRWYRGPIVRGRRVFPAMLLGACAILVASGCGGGARQDAHEPKGTFAMRIVKASFPSKQAIARPSKLELQVRNTGAHTVPNVAVTLDSCSYTDHFPEL